MKVHELALILTKCPPSADVWVEAEHGNGMDPTIPSVTWNRVIRAAGLPDYLCVSCIVEEFAKIQEGFTAELSGEQLHKVPVEFRIGSEPARTAAELSAENTRLRAVIAEIAEMAGHKLNQIIRGRP